MQEPRLSPRRLIYRTTPDSLVIPIELEGFFGDPRSV